ncbi:MAG: hypothetical protein U5J97_11335 [Trueperaceae bacterium]|nr:hypothetical protein [Trueperaceae bacterium]
MSRPPFPSPSVRRLRPLLVVVCLALLALSTAPAFAQRVDAQTRTIALEPSGGDDTAAVQAALDACVTFGPDCTVALGEGTFRTQQLLVHDFRGTFRGAGQDVTVLEPFERFTVSQDEVAIGRPPSPENPWPFHVTFVGGDVTVSDLTFRMAAPEPAHPWTLFGMEFTVMASSLVVTGERADATLERITVEGADGGFEGYNIINGVYIEGLLPDEEGNPTRPLRGTFTVRDSTFRHVAYGSPLFNLIGAQVLVTGNRYEDLIAGMDTQDLTGSTVEIRGNVMDDVDIGVEVIQGSWAVPEALSTMLIHGNEVRGPERFGVGLDGAEGADTLRAIVRGNLFELSGDATGVLSQHTVGAIVHDNVMQGSARAAIAIGVTPDDEPAPPVARWLVAANDFAGLTASEAMIVLGPGSQDTTVVCTDAATVRDEGTGNRVVCDL